MTKKDLSSDWFVKVIVGAIATAISLAMLGLIGWQAKTLFELSNKMTEVSINIRNINQIEDRTLETYNKALYQLKEENIALTKRITDLELYINEFESDMDAMAVIVEKHLEGFKRVRGTRKVTKEPRIEQQIQNFDDFDKNIKADIYLPRK